MQLELLHITTKGRPRHMHQPLLVETFPWEPAKKGNTSVSLVIDSKPAETTETTNVGLTILNVLCPAQKLPVLQSQLWRGSSYLLPRMAPCYHAKMMNIPKCPHHRSSLSPAFSQSQASPPQDKLSKVFQVSGF